MCITHHNASCHVPTAAAAAADVGQYVCAEKIHFYKVKHFKYFYPKVIMTLLRAACILWLCTYCFHHLLPPMLYMSCKILYLYRVRNNRLHKVVWFAFMGVFYSPTNQCVIPPYDQVFYCSMEAF